MRQQTLWILAHGHGEMPTCLEFPAPMEMIEPLIDGRLRLVVGGSDGHPQPPAEGHVARCFQRLDGWRNRIFKRCELFGHRPAAKPGRHPNCHPFAHARRISQLLRTSKQNKAQSTRSVSL